MAKFTYDSESADNAIYFIENLITHVKGELANKPFILEEWQKEDIIKPLFGWKRKDGTRRYRKAYIEIPRKNGKSNLCAAIALLLLFIDKEPGAEIYSAAGERNQAGIVFDIAKQMINNNKLLSERAKNYRNSIVLNKDLMSFYQAISADADTKHGYNAHGIIFDELHTQPNRNLWDVLTTSVGARRQPLVVAITTAGFDKNSICWEVHDYACKVRDGVIDDDTFLPVIYAADAEDPIDKEETWKKANPGYGSIVKKEYIQQEAKKAKDQPSYENTFRRLHLNQWTSSDIKWISDDKWTSCEREIQIPIGTTCWGGLDLATVKDLCAYTMTWEIDDGLYQKTYYWCPEDTVLDNNEYKTWVNQGFMFKTDGNVTDYNFIKSFIMEQAEKYPLASLEYDRFNASQLIIDLTDEGINCRPFGQGFVSMSAPTKAYEQRILLGSENKPGALFHDGNPVTRWNFDNVMLREDPAGNIKIDKAKSTNKVDGAVSCVMSLGGYMTDESDGLSGYETKDLVLL